MRVLKISAILMLLSSPMGLAHTAERTPSAPNASVYIISPQQGEVVTSPVTVKFGLQGMGVAPAGVEKAKTGHHHLLIDTTMTSLDQPIGKDAQHRHFGGGQTQAQIELAPGKHTLQLVLGDHKHIPHNPPVVSEVVTITVVE